jgi:hypothetical protein
MIKTRRKMWGLPALGLMLCAAPALLQGCGGGGSGSATMTGTFTGTAPNLGANRAGTLTLTTYSSDRVTGSLNVTDVPVAVGPRAVTLPTGAYNFEGNLTGNGSTFSATGTSTGITPVNFTITGTLSTTTTTGSFTIAGTFNNEQFSFNGSINVRVTPTPTGTPTSGNSGFTFSSVQNSNANTAALNNTVNVGSILNIPTNNNFLLSASFTATISATDVRVLSITVVKTGSFAVGDTFTLDDTSSINGGSGTVLYTEGAPVNKTWISHSGTAKITAISGSNVSLELISAHMEPSTVDTPGQTNNATGQFTLNGSGTVQANGL